MSTAEMGTTAKKWISSAGPIQTKKVDKALRDLRFHGQATTRISDYGTSTAYSLFGAPRQEVLDKLAEIGEKFGHQVTRANYKDIIEACEQGKKDCPTPVIDERKTDEEKAEHAREMAELKAKQEERERIHAEEKAKHLEELRAKYPWVEGPNGKPECVRAAANIRRDLARTFPGIVFSVTTSRYSMGNSVTVKWELGPTTAEVRKVTDKYRGGTFDGMTDSYDSDNSAWGKACQEWFGYAKYVSEERDGVYELLDVVCRSLCEKQHVEYQGIDTRNVFGEGDYNRTAREYASIYMSKCSLPPGAKVTGVEEVVYEDGMEDYEPYRIAFEVPEGYTAPAAGEGDDDSQASEGAGYRIEKHHHTKRGCDFWIVVMDGRVGESEFERLRSSCKRAGGWYSRKWGRTPGGFAFEDQGQAAAWAKSALATSAAA